MWILELWQDSKSSMTIKALFLFIIEHTILFFTVDLWCGPYIIGRSLEGRRDLEKIFLFGYMLGLAYVTLCIAPQMIGPIIWHCCIGPPTVPGRPSMYRASMVLPLTRYVGPSLPIYVGPSNQFFWCRRVLDTIFSGMGGLTTLGPTYTWYNTIGPIVNN